MYFQVPLPWRGRDHLGPLFGLQGGVVKRDDAARADVVEHVLSG
jgi:hypothetical protein